MEDRACRPGLFLGASQGSGNPGFSLLQPRYIPKGCSAGISGFLQAEACAPDDYFLKYFATASPREWTWSLE
jgi:hypothetical protein